MQPCQNCGAPLDLRGPDAMECDFCGVQASASAYAPQRVELQVTVFHAPGEPGLRCPHCDRGLARVKLGEVELHGCGRCAGIWIDNDDAAKVIAAPDRAFWQLANSAARLAQLGRTLQPRPQCPVCARTLVRTEAHELVLDLCADHGTWFDAGELGTLVMKLRARPDEGAVPKVRCIGCQQQVPQRDTLVGELGPVCPPCARSAKLATLPKTSDGVAGSLLLGIHAALYTHR